MSEFKIKVGAVRQVKSDLNTCSRNLGTISGDIGRVKRSLRWKVQSRDLIDQRLNTLMADIGRNKSYISKCSSVLDQVVNEYCTTESSLVDSPFKKALNKLIESSLPIALATLNPLTPVSILTLDREQLTNIFDFIDTDSLKEKTKISHSKEWKKKKERSESFLIDDDDVYLKTTDSKPREGFEEITDEDELKKAKKEYEDFEKAEKALNDAETIYEKELLSGDYTFWEKNDEKKFGLFSDKLNVKLGSAEYYAKASVTTVGFAAEAGGSMTAFSMEDKVMFGSDTLGVYAEAELQALKAEGKIGAQAGIVEIDGKKVVAAHAGASAEAILVDASIKGGTKVLGTDISGSIGANVGIGAHADIGIQGGKVKVDIGASLGVGVSADFEVDFSGTIDAVCEHADEIANFMGNTVDTVSNAFTDTFNSLGNLFGQ